MHWAEAVCCCCCCLLFLISGSEITRGDVCVIPVGEFEGMIVGTNTKEPYYGSRCPNRSAVVQVTKKLCMSRYCCEEPCTCDSPNINQDYFSCPNGSAPLALTCFVIHIENERTAYSCCPGTEEDEFQVCSKAVDCSANNGDCDQLCLQDPISAKDHCACYDGYKRRLTNSNGTTQCIGNGPIPTIKPSGTATVSSSTITPAAQVVPAGFPLPYIIAIILFLLLLLLLLVLLLLCCCCRKKKTTEKKSLHSIFVIASTRHDDTGKVKVVADDVKVVDGVKVKEFGDDNDINNRIENEYSEDPVVHRGPPRATEDHEGPLWMPSLYSNKIGNEDTDDKKSTNGSNIYEEIPDYAIGVDSQEVVA